MSVPGLDPRLNAYRDDLADISLKGQVEAAKFVDGKELQVISHFADLSCKPNEDAGLDAQILFGETVRVFDQHNGRAWVQNVADGYVGYVDAHTLGSVESLPTHIVLAPRTFLYPGADLKLPRSGYRSMGSKLVVIDAVTNRGTDYLILSSGEAVIAKHLIELGDWKNDYVAVAETLLHTPYLWGGNTGFGIDCSGLVSLAFALCGKTVLRDSDMQAATIGEIVEPQDNYAKLQRGDLVFWKGHVGIMANKTELLHANGNSMNVTLENFAAAVERIGYLYGQPTLVRRP